MSLTGESCNNSQGEPDIDYVEYLENLVADRHNYARIQIEKDREDAIEQFMLEKDGVWANKLRNKPITID